MSMSVIKEPRQEHKEFELERVILFSDAVFAIAITLLIIEIKLPHVPEHLAPGEYSKVIQPFVFEFFTFVASFAFIGNFWIRHLQLCRFMQHYNIGLVYRNLFFLFFVVCFPFSAAAMMHLTTNFVLPMFIYLGNLAGCLAGLFWLSYYVFQRNPGLAIAGHHTEKELLYQRFKYNFFTVATVFTTLALSFFIFPDGMTIQRLSYTFIPALVLFNYFRIRIKKRNTLRLVHIGDKSS
ncbi:TMEM175 family protein [Chitinophaga solisilvae]|uniref:DUF1211 domain-containing protein n=1 Tax=Chitinophaga solisilvae TaxID=1233460 RepID=A0A433WES9_9BACT|nr:TMEM175 family protein [Chitinophaga solisilvae]NSL85476.1 DUF1211 domain-containing protein [Chitinophaga solisilvae]